MRMAALVPGRSRSQRLNSEPRLPPSSSNISHGFSSLYGAILLIAPSLLFSVCPHPILAWDSQIHLTRGEEVSHRKREQKEKWGVGEEAKRFNIMLVQFGFIYNLLTASSKNLHPLLCHPHFVPLRILFCNWPTSKLFHSEVDRCQSRFSSIHSTNITEHQRYARQCSRHRQFRDKQEKCSHQDESFRSKVLFNGIQKDSPKQSQPDIQSYLKGLGFETD